ncbi:MAG: 2-C-methyl-D-erythritol 2,4-cyclodiphosphate synthase, partial [Chloroflexi bacterium]|nr:2-C-methyl-D-erythritol 2,4-cyclodiphosphate synthase [Chloroflexota bacterium]
MARLLRGGSITIILGLMALVLLAACSSDGDDEATGGASPTAVPATAVAPAPDAKPTVETLIITDATPTVESNNPWKLENPRTPYFMRPMYESLIGVDPLTGEFVPQLATSFSVEPDGTSLRFILRQGVRFHGDNGEFTAADVVAVHANSTQEDSVHTHRTQYRAVTIEVIGPYEVVFRTDIPNPELIPNISERNTISMEIYSGKDMEALGGDPDLGSRPPAGTGFYEYDDRFQSTFFRMKKIPYEHWQNQGEFEKIEMRFISESSTRLAGLLITGDEEGPSVNGTRKVLEWLDRRGEKLDACVVGEPTHPAALGDIGEMFPDDDEANRGRDSKQMLAAAMQRVSQAGYRVVNIDCVVMAQRPKIGPHREAIRRSIAEVLGIEPDQVSVKAKTGEGVGPIGREEAIGA